MYYFLNRRFDLLRKMVKDLFAFLALATVLLGSVCGAEYPRRHEHGRHRSFGIRLYHRP